jgi:hypothetical protein
MTKQLPVICPLCLVGKRKYAPPTFAGFRQAGGRVSADRAEPFLALGGL